MKSVVQETVRLPHTRLKRTCGKDPNLSILEVESTEDLCLTPQTGAVCSRGSTGGGSSGQEAVQQCAPPAVDVLGGDPLAAQNVAGLSPQHAPQPVAAASLLVPRLANTSTVPPQESASLALAGARKTPPTASPEILSNNSEAKVRPLEEGPTVEITAEGVRSGGPLPSSSLVKDCSLSVETQRRPSPSSDRTGRDLHYGSQTDKGRSQTKQTDCVQDQAQAPEVASGLVVVTASGVEEGQSLSDRHTLEYKQETGANQELEGGEHTVGNILPQPHFQSCSTTPPPLVPCPSADSTVKDNTEDSGMEQYRTAPLAQANQGSHIPLSNAKEQLHQNLEEPSLPVSLSDNSPSKQTDLSTQLGLIKQFSNDDQEMLGESTTNVGGNLLQDPSVSNERHGHIKDLIDTSHIEEQPSTAEILETPKLPDTSSGVYIFSHNSSSSADRVVSENIEKNQHSEWNDAEEQATAATTLVDSFQQESSTETLCATSHFEAELVGSRQVVQFVEAETCNPPDHVHTIETPLISELVHSAGTPGIVIVREEAHISGEWSEVHVNQSYLVQREDGSVCEAAVVDELSSELSTGEPKMYGENLQSHIEIDSQPMEVYEICHLVEEVAEETICVGSGAQMPHSPGYEVNLFNALLDHSEEYVDFPSSGDTIEMEVCPNVSHSLSTQTVFTVGQHLVLDANQVDVTDSGQVCVVQAAVLTSNSPSFQETDNSAQMVAPGLQSNIALSDQAMYSVSAAIQMLPEKREAEVTVDVSSLVPTMEVVAQEETVADSSLPVSLPAFQAGQQQTLNVTVVSATKPEPHVSSPEGTKENPTLTETPSQNIQNVALIRETKPEDLRSTPSSGVINPKYLLLKPGCSPLLKTPPSLLTQVSKQQNVAVTLTNAHSSDSGTVAVECLPQTVSAAESVAVGSQKDRLQSSVSTTSAPTPPTKALQPSIVPTNTPSLPAQPVPDPPTPSQSESDKEALIVTKIYTVKAGPVPQIVVIPKASTPPSSAQPSDVSAPSVDVTDTSPASATTTAVVSQADSLCQHEVEEEEEEEEEESEEMEQGRSPGAAEHREADPGPDSSPEEASDEEDNHDDTNESGMVTPSPTEKHGKDSTDRKALLLKVRQWIADRVTVSSSPVSPSTSSPSPYPSSTSDWSASLKTSPLRGPHGKFLSPYSMGTGSNLSSPSPIDQSTPQRPRGERHTDMAELAKHEADTEHRIQSLKREGFWSMKRLTRLTEPVRPKVHWDYLCEEMQWLSADFAQERRWKRGVARKVVRMVMRHHEDLRQREEKAKKEEHAKIRRVASSIAKEVRAFWSSVEKVVQYKQQSRLEEKRKKAMDLHLDFIVGQSEKYSDLLSQSLAPTTGTETEALPPQKSVPSAVDEDDRDFEPPCEEEDDDEETIDKEEQQQGNDGESHRREIELLKEESMLSLDQLLSTLKRPQDSGSEGECSEGSSSTVEEEDGEFTANEEDAEDEEDTIDAQEKVEGNVDHAEELNDLNREGDMSMEELLEKYKGAYASDFEEASASKASSESEVSGDEEVETEEDESDVENNTSSSDSPEDSEEDDDSEKDEEDSVGEEEEDDCGDEGMEVLLKEGDNSPPSSGPRPKKEISHIAATAESLQPKGYTLATTKVKTPIPFLLHGTLRDYQHIGMDWLVTMYEKKLNGILADEMGLGKTIQTIALLAHLACEKGNWGPHLIIVPTSVMLNWEMELKRWCPGFKILTYYGSQKERKLKRQGWTKPNAFHVCITSYKLVLQDHQAFRRKSWRYLILDEAQNIKNFKSQRWQSLLNFNSHRRLLLTGTPLQNSLMELWSLMHFLMPHVFQSHREFKEWFSNPLTGMIEGSQEYNEGLVKRLHKVLRPFLLRRIKIDVEKQMPKKYEHVVRCRLSKRQRFLYDDFMAQATTRETLAGGHFMSVINILMQLRKVCNHPNLFDPRPIHSPFITRPIVFRTASLVQDALEVHPFKRCDQSMFDLVSLEGCVSRYQADVFLPRYKVGRQLIQEIAESPEPLPRPKPVRMKVNRMFQPPPKADGRTVLLMNKPTCPVPPAAQTPLITEVTPAPAPVVQQVVCSVAPTPLPRPPVPPVAQIAIRSRAPDRYQPVLTVRQPTVPRGPSVQVHSTPPPSNIMPQRVLLSPDMQARLPSGEVVSIAQLASLAGRPMSCQGSKPVTFQLQGNKLTLSGAHIHQVPVAPPRPVQGNVMHLVSSGGQHHLISTAPQLLSTANTHPVNTSSPTPSGTQLPLNVSSQVPSTMVSSPGIVKIVVRQHAAAGKESGHVPTLAVAPSPRVAPHPSLSLHQHPNTPLVRNPTPLHIAQRTPGPATATYTIAPPRIPCSTPSHPQPPRPILKVVQPPPATEQPAPARVNAATASSSSSSKASAPPTDDSSSSKIALPIKSSSSAAGKAPHRPRPVPPPPPRSPFYMSWLEDSRKRQHASRLDLISRVNDRHCGAKPVYGQEVLDFLTFLPGPCPSPAPPSPHRHWGRSGHSSCLLVQSQQKGNDWSQSDALREAIHTTEERLELLRHVIDRFAFVIPPVEAPTISMHCCHPPPSLSHKQALFSSELSARLTPLTHILHRIQCNMRTHFPDLRLIQYDCGKLQTLQTLLRKLKTGGHRVLIFTQMTRMLDVLEQFLNYHGHIYLRLDGSTRVEMRQSLMERFNADPRVFCFILSTRSGGVGVNLTGADTVVFYDSDWNPTMDAQAQDRCHRIGQTRDVHIYRLISERTVEENILKKANQKRMLGDMAIEGGNFTTAFFKEQTIRDLFDVNEGEKREVAVELSVPQGEEEEAAVNKHSTTILEQALCRAEDEEDIVAASQAKAEQVAELAEFNENIPLDDGGEQEEVEELSKAEQEIAALVEQLTPIERYAMNFLEASLEDVCKEELKQAEEQVEAARKGLDQAKEEGLKLHASSDEDEFSSPPASVETSQPAPARRGRKPKDKTVTATSTRTSGRLRGASPDTEPEPPTPREVPDRNRQGLRVRGAAKDTSATTAAAAAAATAATAAAAAVAAAAAATPARTDHPRTTTSTKLQESSKSSKASSPARDHQTVRTRTLSNRSLSSPVPSSAPTSPPLSGGKLLTVGEMDSRSVRRAEREKEREKEEKERGASVVSPESSCPVDHQLYSAQVRDEENKDQSYISPPSAGSLPRSPRKRQSADGEVLRGLAEDSPSAKVLRKLPGRLVTVVQEKEPTKRKRRCSSTGGVVSSEETVTTEEIAGGSNDEPSRDPTPHSPDSKTKGTLSKSAQDQDPIPIVQPQPVRAYPPYSPPHHSPDMPVLRNLPVRRRLETESRLAAQLAEQQLLAGRGRGGLQNRKMDTPPGASSSAEPGVNSPVAPVKRKRGRPPKTPLSVPVLSPPPQPTSLSEEGSPPLSPKRKRGRPRKEASNVPDADGAGQNSNKPPSASTTGISNPLSNSSEPLDATTEPGGLTAPTEPQSHLPPTVSTSRGSVGTQSAKAEEQDTKSGVPAPVPTTDHNPTQSSAQAPPDSSQSPASTYVPPAPCKAQTSPSIHQASVSTAQVSSLAPSPGIATMSAQDSAPSTSHPNSVTASSVNSAAASPGPATSTTPVPAPSPSTDTKTQTVYSAPAASVAVTKGPAETKPTVSTAPVPSSAKAAATTPAPTTASQQSTALPCTTKGAPASAPASAATTTVSKTATVSSPATTAAKSVSTPKSTIVKSTPPASAQHSTSFMPESVTTSTATSGTVAVTTISPTTASDKPGTAIPVTAEKVITGSTSVRSVTVTTTIPAKSVGAAASATLLSTTTNVTATARTPALADVAATSSNPAKPLAVQSVAKTVTATKQTPVTTVTTTNTSPVKSESTATTASAPPVPSMTTSTNVTTTAPVKTVTVTSSLPVKTVPVTSSLPVKTVPVTSSLAVKTVPVTSSLPVKTVTVTSSLPVKTVPVTSSLLAKTVPVTSSLPVKAVPIKSSLPVKTATVTSPLPEKTATVTSSLPVKTVPVTSSLPVKTVPVTSSLLAKTVPITSSLPAKTATVTSPLPEKTATVTSSLPVKTVPVTSSLPVKTVPVTSSLPAKTVTVTSPLPEKTTTVTSSLPVKTVPVTSSLAEKTVTVTSPLPAKTVTVTSPLPEKTASITSSLPVKAVAVTSPLPEKTATVTSPLPEKTAAVTSAKTVTVTSPLPEKTATITSSLPVKAVPVTSPLPAKTVAVTSPLPEKTATVTSPLPEKTASVTSAKTVTVTSPLPEKTATVTSPPPAKTVAVTSPLPEKTVTVTSPVPEKTATVTSPLPAKTVAVTSPLPEKTVTVTSPVPEKTATVTSPLPLKTVTVKSPLPEKTATVTSPLPEKTASVTSAKTVTVTSPLPEKTATVTSPPPAKTVAVTSPLPEKTVTVTSPVPEKTATVTSPLPAKTVAVTSPLPEKTVTVTSPVPEKTATVTSPLPLKTVTVKSPLPEKTATVTSPLPEKTATVTSAKTVTVTSPLQEKTATVTSPLPAKTVTVTSPLPAKTVTVTSPLPAKTVTVTSPLPEKTVTVTSSLPEKTVTVTSSLPEKTVTVTSPLPEKTITVTSPLPAQVTMPTGPSKNIVTTPSKQVPASTLITEESVSATVSSAATQACAKVTHTTQAPTATSAVSTTVSASTTKTSPPPTTTQTPAVVSPLILDSTPTNIPPVASNPTPAPSIVSSAVTVSVKQSSKPTQKESADARDSVLVTDVEVDTMADNNSGTEAKESCKSEPIKRKAESSLGAKVSVNSPTPSPPESETPVAHQQEKAKQQEEMEKVAGDESTFGQKRLVSRQSSQESARSSSPSSSCSSSTLTRHAHHKKTYENRHPAKRRRVDNASEKAEEELQKAEVECKEDEARQGGKEEQTTTSRRGRSRSPSSSSDSDSSESRKERRLTRSVKRGLQDQEKEGESHRQKKRTARSSERNKSNSTAESGSDTSSVRVTRKSAGSQPTTESKPQTNSVPAAPPEPEVLGKRCSALNAAAKLLAMKGRVDTPGHTTRKDYGAKAGNSPASSTDKNQKSKSKSVPASPQTNSLNTSNNKPGGSKPPTPTQTSRSTRQCPGSLLPPLDLEVKRCRLDKDKAKEKAKEKDGSKKSSEGKEREGEGRSSSRGHSACSSMSSDGEGEGGGHSSRSRSSSNSSQRTLSGSSQGTEPRESRSRATSSGSERDRKDGEGQARDSFKDGRQSQRSSQDVGSSSGAEGTPDRVLRSITALAAAHARSPAASTRSGQLRHNKT